MNTYTIDTDCEPRQVRLQFGDERFYVRVTYSDGRKRWILPN